MNTDAPEHEGYPLALVERRYSAGSASTYRAELRSGEEPHKGITLLQAGCECGWRSEHISVYPPVEWDGIVFAPEAVRARLERLWCEHIELTLYRRRRTLTHEQEGDARTRRVFGAVLLEALDGLDRCRCGHLRHWHDTTSNIGPGGIACDVKDCTCERFAFMPVPP